MNEIVNNFFEQEKKFDIEIKVLPNGIQYLSNKVTKWNILHQRYTGLSDGQIQILQDDINQEQHADYVFPAWYNELLKTTNGFNIFFNAISFYGEQTPAIWDKKEKSYKKATLQRMNPDWMAPYNLRNPNSVKYDKAAQNRWLVLGTYHCDGTNIAWDYEKEKIVAMYIYPITTPIKVWKKLKIIDYEKLVFMQWDSFDEFFVRETERLRKVVEKCGVDSDYGFIDWKKSLPIGHKDFQE